LRGRNGAEVVFFLNSGAGWRGRVEWVGCCGEEVLIWGSGGLSFNRVDHLGLKGGEKGTQEGKSRREKDRGGGGSFGAVKRSVFARMPAKNRSWETKRKRCGGCGEGTEA